MEETNPENGKCCSKCNINKTINDFREKRQVCKSCDNESKRLNYNNNKETRDKLNEKRKEKYNTDEEHRKKLIKIAGDFKRLYLNIVLSLISLQYLHCLLSKPIF